jgi:hypothetical protein
VLLNFAVEYTIRKVEDNQGGPELNGINQVFVYARSIDLLDENINAIKITQKIIFEIKKGIGLEVNTDKN